MKKIIHLFLLLVPLLFACQTHVDYETKEKNTNGKTVETNNYYVTTQAASKVCFYKQNKNGDPELSTYLHDTASDSSQKIVKGTPISQLSFKTYTGFTYYTAFQIGETLNVYYNRNLVTYDFYTAKTDGTQLYRLSGLYDTKVEGPKYTANPDYYLIGWKDSNGDSLGSKFGESNKIYYPELLSKASALGTKGIADTKGDILLDDGSVISYSEFTALTDKSSIISHAYAVLVCTNYDSGFATSATPGDTFVSTLESEKSSLFAGKQKLIAAVYKSSSAEDLAWVNNNTALLNYPLNLNDYIDGSVNMELIKSFKTDDGDFTKGKNALASAISYGKEKCPKTAYTDDWYIPSLGELYALHLLISDSNYSDLYTSLFSLSGVSLWTSNAIATTDSDLTTWSVNFNNSDISSLSAIARTTAKKSLPFRKIN